MRNLVLVIICGACLTSTGCASLGEAMFDFVFDTAASSIFGDDCGCDTDPQLLKRKGIEPGSKAHRKFCREEEAQAEFFERN